MITTRLGIKSDIESVIKLQDQNLVHKMDPEHLKFGFVTTPFTDDMIEFMINEEGLFVAQNENKELVAYVFAGRWEFYLQWEIFEFMTARFSSITFNNKEITIANSFQYGPICIAKKYRGQGIINLIFEEMRLTWIYKFDHSFTFINKANKVSTNAHIHKLGWTIVDEFLFNNNTYLSLGYDMSKSALR